MSNVSQAMHTFVDQWLAHQASNHIPLTIDFDEQWPSPCYQSSTLLQDGDECAWRPVSQPTNTMFERLGEALETQIHPDLIAYYSTYWSNHLSAQCDDGELELLQVWNEEDLERLRSNLIGHAMLKKKKRQPLSLFFALTLPDEGMLCIDNESGEIWYELPGKKPIRKVADNLASFIESLSPGDSEQ